MVNSEPTVELIDANMFRVTMVHGAEDRTKYYECQEKARQLVLAQEKVARVSADVEWVDSRVAGENACCVYTFRAESSWTVYVETQEGMYPEVVTRHEVVCAYSYADAIENATAAIGPAVMRRARGVRIVFGEIIRKN